MCGKAAGPKPSVSLVDYRDRGAWANGPPTKNKQVSFLPESQLGIYARMSEGDFKEVSSGSAPKLIARVVAQRNRDKGEPSATA
eukprot:3474014-Pyramimonas_sp.AAC.1